MADEREPVAGRVTSGDRRFRICFTSDTHGHVLPFDYASGDRADTGLANLCALMGSATPSERFADDVLVLDGGDSLQGTPLISRWLAEDGVAHGRS